MNDTLKKYDILFKIHDAPNGHKYVYIISQNDALLNYHLGGYFLGQSIDFLIEDIIPDIDKALSGKAFEEDAGGTLSFLTIGQSICIFSALDEAKADVSLPTNDVKDIVVAWTDWVINNNLQNFIS